MSPHNPKTVLTCASILACFTAACVVQLPGNLDVGDPETGDSDSGDGDPSTTGDGDPSTTGDGDPTTGDGDPGAIDGDGCQDAVDILLVVDNSGSMGVLQRRLAESVDSLLDPLDEAGVDWRLAVTTTDVGNPWCPSGVTTPEMGAFQIHACNDHIEDFVFNSGEVDVSDIACNDICPYLPGKLHTLPTTTAEDPNPVARPWLEHIGGESNLPEDIDPATASLCLVPQGINGCGFESPLEAMYRALLRARDPMSAEYGFLREDASLLVILATDETDCSAANLEIFEPEGERSFWSDPNDAFPSSAVCWNAGMSCTGDPSGYDDCVATDFNIYGDPTLPDQAVLHPLERYVYELFTIEQQKRAIDPGADVGLLVIGGVAADGTPHFADALADPAFQHDFGIGPGCTDEGPGLDEGGPIAAVPPGRMREVAELMTSAPLASICEPDYYAAFEDLHERLRGSCGD